MKAFLAKTIALSVLSGICGIASADTTVRVVLICSVNDGATMDEVRAANSAWVNLIWKFCAAHQANAFWSMTM